LLRDALEAAMCSSVMRKCEEKAKCKV